MAHIRATAKSPASSTLPLSWSGGVQAEHSEGAPLTLTISYVHTEKAGKSLMLQSTLSLCELFLLTVLSGAWHSQELTMKEKDKAQKNPGQNYYFLNSAAHQSPGISGLQPLNLIRTYIKATDRNQEAFRAPHKPFLEQQPSLASFLLSQKVSGGCKVLPW